MSVTHLAKHRQHIIVHNTSIESRNDRKTCKHDLRWRSDLRIGLYWQLLTISGYRICLWPVVFNDPGNMCPQHAAKINNFPESDTWEFALNWIWDIDGRKLTTQLVRKFC